MSGPLIYRRTLGGAAVFDPNTLNPDYFDETQRTFNGTSDFVNTGLYNTPFTKSYYHILIKVAPADGQPPTIESLFGGRGSNTNSIFYVGIAASGAIFVRNSATTNTAASAAFVNGPNDYRVIRVSRSDKTRIYYDGQLISEFTNAATTQQTTAELPYGAYTTNGTLSLYFKGGGKGLFIWSGTSDLSETNIENLDNYFAAL